MAQVDSRIGVSLPMLNLPYGRYPELATLADEAGFDSLWDYEFFRNPFITHTLNARSTSRIRLATGIATASSRTPFEMANATADVDEISGGRTILGLSGNYVAFPVSSTVIEFMGLQEDRDAVVHALLTEGPQALERATSDALLETFAISGTPDEAREQFARFDGLLEHIVLHTPYVPPITGAESDAAFRATVETFAR